jgi:putative restriction endonuclease
MQRRNWSRNELLVAFNLYCRTPFGKIHTGNPEVISLANAISRTPSAVSWKLANFASIDPTLASRNIKGASHGSKQEAMIWQEFENNWDRLTFESEQALSKMLPAHTPLEIERPEGRTREAMTRIRVNQGFFRSAVLAAYDCRCCITGIDATELLCASHIVPWSIDIPNRTNPRNGLCLNALHDRAFDRGFITITPDFKVRVSNAISRNKDGWQGRFLFQYENVDTSVPKHFQPDPSFLEYHRENIFRK